MPEQEPRLNRRSRKLSPRLRGCVVSTLVESLGPTNRLRQAAESKEKQEKQLVGLEVAWSRCRGQGRQALTQKIMYDRWQGGNHVNNMQVMRRQVSLCGPYISGWPPPFTPPPPPDISTM